MPPGQLTVTWIVICWPTGTGTEILPSGPKLPVARTLPPGPITAKVPPLQPAGNWAPSARRSFSCSAEVVVGPVLLPLLPHACTRARPTSTRAMTVHDRHGRRIPLTFSIVIPWSG